MTRAEMKRYLLKVQEQTTEYLWDNVVTFKPYLVKKKFGDGMCLIKFGCYDDLPYYWLVRVDSKILSREVCLDDEAVYQQIEEECGFYDKYEDEDIQDLDSDETKNTYPYPIISRWSSAHWSIVADLRNGVDNIGMKLNF